MSRIIAFIALSLSFIAHTHAQGDEVSPRLSVAVIAPSVSTSIEAKRIIAQQRWTLGKFKTADAILVVVRSTLSNPLQSNYGFIGELSEDAENQLNIAGHTFHVYLYALGDDLECTQLKHLNYEAD